MGEDHTGRPETPDQRVTVPEAAEILGITAEAVRMRIKRGTLRSERQAGRVFVLLGQIQPTDQPSEPTTLISEMRSRIQFLEDELQRKDAILLNMTEAMKALNPPAPEDSSEARESPESSGRAGGLGEVWDELDTERARREMAESTLHEGMDEERRRREEAERERDDLRRELFALREPRESPQTVEEERKRAEQQPRPATVESQESVKRPWYRRVFGR